MYPSPRPSPLGQGLRRFRIEPIADIDPPTLAAVDFASALQKVFPNLRALPEHGGWVVIADGQTIEDVRQAVVREMISRRRIGIWNNRRSTSAIVFVDDKVVITPFGFEPV